MIRSIASKRSNSASRVNILGIPRRHHWDVYTEARRAGDHVELALGLAGIGSRSAGSRPATSEMTGREIGHLRWCARRISDRARPAGLQAALGLAVGLGPTVPPAALGAVQSIRPFGLKPLPARRVLTAILGDSGPSSDEPSTCLGVFSPHLWSVTNQLLTCH